MPSNLSSLRLLSAFLLFSALIALPFEVAAQRASAGAVQHSTLYSFGGPDGAGPLYGVIADHTGALYGTTVLGGIGGGTVFKLTPAKSGYSETVLYSFLGGADGEGVFSGLVADKKGALYGVTLEGGNGACFAGCGTVFKLTPKKSGYAKSTIYSFGTIPDVSAPLGTLVLDSKGALYGVGQYGGTQNNGAVYKLTPGKSGYRETVIYSFRSGDDGDFPQAGLVMNKRGSLYGTTQYGGPGSCDGGCGTVFRLCPSGVGYDETILYAFKDYTDGYLPYAAVTLDKSTGAIYGTTWWGGTNHDGNVFKLTPSDSGYDKSTIYNFNHHGHRGTNGVLPESQLLLRPDGALYGTDFIGGGGCSGIGCGSVFELKPSGSGYAFTYVYNFLKPVHGVDPEFTSLMVDGSGALYGTTRSGGSKTDCYDGGSGGAHGCGTVFKLVLK
ncbi:MAG: choice-of-anchor tandem repeat GloVer-containing protein [Terriglobales bacterium]